MKGACREEHGHRVLQASESFSQAFWRGLERGNGSAGGMESHKLLCQVRFAVPGRGETAGPGKQNARCCRGIRGRGSTSGRCRLRMCKGQPGK